MLEPLLMEFKERWDSLFLVTASHQAFFYTPVLSENLVTQFLPPRWNETLSVYHIKCYLFDDNVVISGANLSNDYFTTRIDRYVLFENCPNLASFYVKCLSLVLLTYSFFSILSQYSSYLSPDTGKLVRFSLRCERSVMHSVKPANQPSLPTESARSAPQWSCIGQSFGWCFFSRGWRASRK